MGFNTDEFILGSRSPRRRELLQLIVPGALIRQLPPRSEEEPGFERLHDWEAIDRRLQEIARGKCDDVLAQLAEEQPAGDEPRQVVITADTTIVVGDSRGRLHALGQPPEGDGWKEVVRGWFRDYYVGKTHTAVTALCVAVPGERPIERIVKTAVTFHADAERRVERYLESGEPRGKAGGYAIQGAGGIFVSKVEGSLSNVVGLPLEALLEIFEQLELIDA